MPRYFKIVPFTVMLVMSASAGFAAVPAGSLRPVAVSRWQWTGIAVSPDHDIFVNYPRWSDRMEWSVARLNEQMEPEPYPDQDWNSWQMGEDDTEKKFVCVQSVYMDARGFLWILDTGNPFFKGVVPGGAKLIKIDPRRPLPDQIYSFGQGVLEKNSYLNDVRIDVDHNFAYLTDSHAGGLVVLDLETGEARRVLEDHPSTHSEGVTIRINGQPWLMDGEAPRVHADGIAYDRKSDLLYYQALTGETLYRISAARLRNFSLSEEQLAGSVQTVSEHFPVDGIIADWQGRIYLSDLEGKAIKRWSPERGIESILSSSKIAWPDSFAWAPGFWLYFTTSRIHQGDNPSQPYAIYRVQIYPQAQQ
ncbi:MAG: L-dopachrome tautomerase-related protein [Candidatus Omnitrophota bacterium]